MYERNVYPEGSTAVIYTHCNAWWDFSTDMFCFDNIYKPCQIIIEVICFSLYISVLFIIFHCLKFWAIYTTFWLCRLSTGKLLNHHSCNLQRGLVTWWQKVNYQLNSCLQHNLKEGPEETTQADKWLHIWPHNSDPSRAAPWWALPWYQDVTHNQLNTILKPWTNSNVWAWD